MRLFEILDFLLFLCVVAALSASFAYLLSIGRLFGALRKHEPAVFESLGEPSLLRPTGGSKSAVMAYLQDRDYELSGSQEVQTAGALVRRLLILSKSALVSSILIGITMTFSR